MSLRTKSLRTKRYKTLADTAFWNSNTPVAHTGGHRQTCRKRAVDQRDYADQGRELRVIASKSVQQSESEAGFRATHTHNSVFRSCARRQSCTKCVASVMF